MSDAGGLRRRHWIRATDGQGNRLCTRVRSACPFHVHYKRKRKRNRKGKKRLQPQSFELLDEIVWEILIRLPVESLARFKSVSKAWFAMISDPSFILAHLQWSKQKQQQNPSSFLITPHFFMEPADPALKTLSNDIGFYKWNLHKATATLLYGRHFPAAEFGSVSEVAHCDGLILLPTDTKAYVFNPAIRDAIALPESKRSIILPYDHVCLPIGFGLDTFTGKYKVARCFYRSCNGHPPMETFTMGMEIFTINGGDSSWREISVDPPYPVVNSRTATYCKGYLFYFINKNDQQKPLQGLLCFSLVDETFGVTPLIPDVYPRVEDEDIYLTELHGELYASFLHKDLDRAIIYVTTGDIVNPTWSFRYVVYLPSNIYPIASHGSSWMLLREDNCITGYNLEAHRRPKGEISNLDYIRYIGPNEDNMGYECENVSWFDVVSYTESLVPVTSKASLHAS